MDAFWTKPYQGTSALDVKEAEKQRVPPSIAPLNQSVSPVAVDSKDFTDYTSHFQEIMDKANLPGPDYYEFSKAISEISDMAISEQQKFTMVFSGFKAQGVTPQKLVEAAKQYIDILNSDKENGFNKELSDAESYIQGQEVQITKLQDEIASLQKKITENTNSISTMNTQTRDLKAKLASRKSSYESTYNGFIAKINEDIGKINNYLYGTTK